MQEADMIEEVDGDHEIEHREVGGTYEDGDLGHDNGEMQQDKVGVLPGVETQGQGQGQTLNCKEGGVDVKKEASNEGVGGKLTVEEDRIEGVVTWATYIQYAKDGGGYESPCILYTTYDSRDSSQTAKFIHRHSRQNKLTTLK